YQQQAPAIVAAEVTPAWTANAGGAVQSHLVRSGDALYVTTMGNDLVVLDPATGKERWRFAADDSIFSTPIIDNGLVYFGSAEHFFVGAWDNTLRAIDAASGKIAWEKKIGKDKNGKIQFYYSPAISSPAVGDGKVFVTTNDGILHAFDANTGDVAWEFDGKKV